MRYFFRLTPQSACYTENALQPRPSSQGRITSGQQPTASNWQPAANNQPPTTSRRPPLVILREDHIRQIRQRIAPHLDLDHIGQRRIIGVDQLNLPLANGGLVVQLKLPARRAIGRLDAGRQYLALWTEWLIEGARRRGAVVLASNDERDFAGPEQRIELGAGPGRTA